MNFKNQQKFANFKNLKNILTNFMFAIFTQYHIQIHTMIIGSIMSKFQFIKQSIIYHQFSCNNFYFERQCRSDS